MKHFHHAVVAFGFVLATSVPAWADNAADARAIIEKAVKAHGGQDKLDKFPCVTSKIKGTFHGMGMEIAMTGEITQQAGEKQKIDIELAVGGEKIQIAIVVAGDKGWLKIGNDTTELDKDKLAESKEQLYGGWVASLAPLKDKKYKLSTLGESKVNDRPALGVKVSCKDHRDIDLFFDKETGLVVRTEARVKDDNGQEVIEESFPSAYKDVKGTKQATKVKILRDGKLFMEFEATEVHLAEEVDDITFAKP